MKKEKKARKSGQYLMILLFMVIGIFCGLFGIDYIESTLSEESRAVEKLLRFAVLLIFLYLAIIIHLIVHEAGHLLFGKISGYQFASFRIGSLMLVKKNGRIKLKRYSLMGTGGQCLMMPPEEYNENIPVLLYNLGGSLANLAVSGIALVIYFISGGLPTLSLFCLILTIFGVAFALINGIPMHFGPIDNDGYNAFNLGKDKAAKWCFWLQLRMNGLITQGVRLKDMPEEWFDVPSNEDMKNALCASIGVYACSRAMDVMDFETAKKIGYNLLENAEGLLGIHKHFITAEIMFCELMGENRTEEVEKMFTKEFKRFLKVSAKNPSVVRTLYAYELLSKKDEQAAQKRLAAFEKVAATYPHACEIESERELIAYTDHLNSSK